MPIKILSKYFSTQFFFFLVMSFKCTHLSDGLHCKGVQFCPGTISRQQCTTKKKKKEKKSVKLEVESLTSPLHQAKRTLCCGRGAEGAHGALDV